MHQPDLHSLSRSKIILHSIFTFIKILHRMRVAMMLRWLHVPIFATIMHCHDVYIMAIVIQIPTSHIITSSVANFSVSLVTTVNEITLSFLPTSSFSLSAFPTDIQQKYHFKYTASPWHHLTIHSVIYSIRIAHKNSIRIARKCVHSHNTKGLMVAMIHLPYRTTQLLSWILSSRTNFQYTTDKWRRR